MNNLQGWTREIQYKEKSLKSTSWMDSDVNKDLMKILYALSETTGIKLQPAYSKKSDRNIVKISMLVSGVQ
jgi:hypothetical protein